MRLSISRSKTPLEAELADKPVPLIPAQDKGIVAERLVSINGLISLVILSWSALVLVKPAVLRKAIQGVARRCPSIVGFSPHSECPHCAMAPANRPGSDLPKPD
jgi:hypothetical protein